MVYTQKLMIPRGIFLDLYRISSSLSLSSNNKVPTKHYFYPQHKYTSLVGDLEIESLGISTELRGQRKIEPK